MYIHTCTYIRSPIMRIIHPNLGREKTFTFLFYKIFSYNSFPFLASAIYQSYFEALLFRMMRFREKYFRKRKSKILGWSSLIPGTLSFSFSSYCLFFFYLSGFIFLFFSFFRYLFTLLFRSILCRESGIAGISNSPAPFFVCMHLGIK